METLKTQKKKYIIGFALTSTFLFSGYQYLKFIKRKNNFEYQIGQFTNDFYVCPKTRLQSQKTMFRKMLKKHIDTSLLKIQDPRFNKPIFCGVPFKYLQPCFECIDCSLYNQERQEQGNFQRPKNSTVFCEGCYNESDHTGHQVQKHINYSKTDESGFCDCGDLFELKKESICKNHVRPSEEELKAFEMENGVLEDLKIKIKQLLYAFFSKIESLMISGELKKKQDYFNIYIDLILRYLSELVDINLVVGNYILDVLMEKFTDSKHLFYHSCDQEAENKDKDINFGIKYPYAENCIILEDYILQDEKSQCKCSIFEHFIRLCRYLTPQNQVLLQETVKRWMALSTGFRVHLGCMLFKNFNLLILESSKILENTQQKVFTYSPAPVLELLQGCVCRQELVINIFEYFNGKAHHLEMFLLQAFKKMDWEKFLVSFHPIVDFVVEILGCLLDNDVIIRKYMLNQFYLQNTFEMLFMLEKLHPATLDVNELQKWLLDKNGISTIIMVRALTYLFSQIRYNLTKNAFKSKNEFAMKILNISYIQYAGKLQAQTLFLKLSLPITEYFIDAYMNYTQDLPTQKSLHGFMQGELFTGKHLSQSFMENKDMKKLTTRFMEDNTLYLSTTLYHGISENLLRSLHERLRAHPQGARLFEFVLTVCNSCTRGEYDREHLFRQVVMLEMGNMHPNNVIHPFAQLQAIDITNQQAAQQQLQRLNLGFYGKKTELFRIFFDETPMINYFGTQFSNLQIKDHEKHASKVENIYKKVIISILQLKNRKATFKEIDSNTNLFLFDKIDNEKFIKSIIEKVAILEGNTYVLKEEYNNKLYKFQFSRNVEAINPKLIEFAKSKVEGFDPFFGSEFDIETEFNFLPEIRAKSFGNLEVIKTMSKFYQNLEKIFGVDVTLCGILILRIYFKIYEDYITKERESEKNPGNLPENLIDQIYDTFIGSETIDTFLNHLLEKQIVSLVTIQNMIDLLKKLKKVQTEQIADEEIKPQESIQEQTEQIVDEEVKPQESIQEQKQQLLSSPEKNQSQIEKEIQENEEFLELEKEIENQEKQEIEENTQEIQQNLEENNNNIDEENKNEDK